MRWFSVKTAALCYVFHSAAHIYTTYTRAQIDNKDLVKHGKVVEVSLDSNTTSGKETVVIIPLDASERFRWHMERLIKDNRIMVVKSDSLGF